MRVNNRPRLFAWQLTYVFGGIVSDNIGPQHENIVSIPDSKVHGANMGPIWGRQADRPYELSYLGKHSKLTND